MLKHRAHLNALDKDGLTPLHWAAMTGRPETVKVLVERGAAINNVSKVCGVSPLQLACYKSPDSVRLLIDHGANVNEQAHDRSPTAVQCAVEATSGAPTLPDYKKDIDILRLLLARGADINMLNGRGNTAIDTAIKEGCPEIVPLLQGRTQKVVLPGFQLQ